MENIQKTFDVIVVGAGTGGSTAARFAAKHGLNVCLIDTKQKSNIGDKICGDAVGTEIFDFLKISPPKNEELSCYIKGAKLYSPNLQKCITLLDPKQAGFIVNRLEFGQRLLNEALDAGVNQFLDNTKALGLVYKGGKICGIQVKMNDGSKVEFKAKIVIDASGFYSPLRKTIRTTLIETNISNDDSILCYREIIKLNPQEEVQDPEYISITIDQEKAPGGYIWYFPKNESAINIGLGTFMHYKGQIKNLYRQHAFSQYVRIPNYEILSSGGGVVPVRRPLWSCADDGIMVVGDAACQVNPLHGGGIDPSMRAGFYAATTALNAINVEDYSIHGLWDYNHKVMTSFGAEYAPLDLLRMVLQNLTNEELNFGLSKELLTGNEILELSSSGTINIPLIDMVSKAFRGISKPNLLLDLNYLRIRMNEIAKLYKKFPSDIDKFEEWKLRVNQVYDKIRKMLINSKKVN